MAIVDATPATLPCTPDEGVIAVGAFSCIARKGMRHADSTSR
jgi:hypothetical protein